jgi:aryl carrier-like protein
MATGPITGHLLARMALEIEGEYLPSNYGRLRQYAPLQGRLRSFVRFEGVEEDGESILFSIDILGEHGPVASIERFALRRVAAGRARAKVDAEPSRAWSDAISPAEGVDAFERILAAPEEPHWVILPMSVKGLIARQREELRRAAESSGRRAQVQRRDDDGFAAPRTDAERLLADIYEKVLGVAPIGIHDNFFELGGDSVIGIQIVAQAKARGLQVKPGQLFDFQTIAELAAEVGGSLGASDAAAPPAAAPAPAAASAAAGPDVDDSGLSEEDLKSLLSL